MRVYAAASARLDATCEAPPRQSNQISILASLPLTLLPVMESESRKSPHALDATSQEASAFSQSPAAEGTLDTTGLGHAWELQSQTILSLYSQITYPARNAMCPLMTKGALQGMILVVSWPWS